ncbi:hypothetical protein EJ110_NYTH12711 [Nymphaea thermarum]|nr:hypothetical protein EJ110_NYTH12711 [Nymphaea thermarum]
MGSSQGQEDLAEVVRKLVTDVTTHEEALGNAGESFGQMKDDVKVLRGQMADLMAMHQSLTDTVTALQTEVKELQVKNRTLQRQISVGGGDDWPARVDVQRPAKYKGTRDSREMDDFLFQVEYYIDLQGIVGDDLQIKTAAMLLEGDAVAWWRRKRLVIQKGICTIDTFDDFQRELKTYFMPPNAIRHAYRMVGELKHTGSLRDYSWAQSEVERSNPETLEDAYVVAERLVDTQRKSYTNAFKPSKKPDHGGKKDDQMERKDEPSTQHQAERRTFFRRNDNSQNRVTKCWFCDGNHLARQCPKRSKLNLFELEEALKIEPSVKYVLYEMSKENSYVIFCGLELKLWLCMNLSEARPARISIANRPGRASGWEGEAQARPVNKQAGQIQPVMLIANPNRADVQA